MSNQPARQPAERNVFVTLEATIAGRTTSRTIRIGKRAWQHHQDRPALLAAAVRDAQDALIKTLAPQLHDDTDNRDPQ